MLQIFYAGVILISSFYGNVMKKETEGCDGKYFSHTEVFIVSRSAVVFSGHKVLMSRHTCHEAEQTASSLFSLKEPEALTSGRQKPQYMSQVPSCLFP